MTRQRQITSSTSTPAVIDEKAIDHLFLRFSAMYGHVWNSQFQSEQIRQVIKQEWLSALRRFPKEQIKRGIDLCLSSKELPPTLPAFLGLCRLGAPYHRDYKPPEVTERSDPEVARRAMAKIMKILGNAKK